MVAQRTPIAGMLVFASLVAQIGPSCAQKDAGQVGATRITYWRTLSGAAGDAQDELVRRFNGSQSEIVAECQYQGTYGDLATKLIAATAARSGPDVTQLGTFEIRQFARSGVLVDLTPYLNGETGIDRSDWPATYAHAGEIDGGTYWLPFNVAAPTLYYNREAFADVGLEGPPETWADFFACARTLKVTAGDGSTRAGVALWSNTWPLFSMIWSEGGDLTTQDYANITLNDPVVVRIFTELQQLVREGAAIVPDKASGGHRAAFVNSRAAMILDSQDAFSEVFTQTKGFTPGVANYPAGVKGKVYAPGGGGIAMLAIAPRERRGAAWEFMRFMLAAEQIAFYAKESGYAAFSGSSRRALDTSANDPRLAIISSALPHIRADFSVNMSPAIRNAFDEAFQKILLQDADVHQTLDEADAKAEKAIKAELAK